MFGGGYVYTSELASRGRALEKQREAMFGANSTERQHEEQKTAEYRLKDNKDKFSTTNNSAEMQLTQQVVGLVSKEEYGRRRREMEEGPAAAAAEEAADAAKPKKKKKGKEKAVRRHRASPFHCVPRTNCYGGACGRACCHLRWTMARTAARWRRRFQRSPRRTRPWRLCPSSPRRSHPPPRRRANRSPRRARRHRPSYPTATRA